MLMSKWQCLNDTWLNVDIKNNGFHNLPKYPNVHWHILLVKSCLSLQNGNFKCKNDSCPNSWLSILGKWRQPKFLALQIGKLMSPTMLVLEWFLGLKHWQNVVRHNYPGINIGWFNLSARHIAVIKIQVGKIHLWHNVSGKITL